jgi:hypothetical protein
VLYSILRALYVFLRLFYDAYGLLQVSYELFMETRCVINATNAPARSQSFNAMFNLFKVQGG